MDSPGRLMSSPPKGANLQEELAFWKAQYENLEVELQEFQSSSKDLEAELEKDIEESEKKERVLREKAEALSFEVDEWKTKYRQSKEDSNKAQNVLQKEITTLRESNRSMQYKLRDIEVQNDDFERQARNQTSSLEDLESKYNVSIERGVLLEEEMKNNEQERENLRIESQHLKDELSDLKVELEILQNKLQHSEQTLERDRSRKMATLTTDSLRPPSPVSEASTSATSTTSPSISTPPPAKSETSTVHTSPPSPPLSDASGAVAAKKRIPGPITPLMNKTRMIPTTTPRATGSKLPRHSRGPSISAIPTPLAQKTQSKVQPKTPRIPTSRLSYSTQQAPNTNSRSLHQIRGLIGKMQKLEERVHTARSKLPAPTSTPPRSSPRSHDSTNLPAIPSTVTVRSTKKRVSQSTTTSNHTVNSAEPPRSASRLSFGFNPNASVNANKATEHPSRPSSRASQYTSTTSVSQFARPSSRASVTGRATPLGNNHDTPSRPRSSISGNYAATHTIREPLGPPSRANTPGPKPRSHGFSRSVSMATGLNGGGEGDESWGASAAAAAAAAGRTTPVTARRTTLERGHLGSAIPVNGLSRRQSGGFQAGGVFAPGSSVRRQSGASAASAATNGESGSDSTTTATGIASANSSFGDMRPPSQKGRRLSGVGETF